MTWIVVDNQVIQFKSLGDLFSFSSRYYCILLLLRNKQRHVNVLWQIVEHSRSTVAMTYSFPCIQLFHYCGFYLQVYWPFNHTTSSNSGNILLALFELHLVDRRFLAIPRSIYTFHLFFLKKTVDKIS